MPVTEAQMEPLVNVMKNMGGIMMACMTQALGPAMTPMVNDLDEVFLEPLPGRDLSQDIRKKIPAETIKVLETLSAGWKTDERHREKFNQLMQALDKKQIDDLVKIVNRHDLGIAKLTTALPPEALAGYLYLATRQNKQFEAMMQEISAHFDTLPKPPRAAKS